MTYITDTQRVVWWTWSGDAPPVRLGCRHPANKQRAGQSFGRAELTVRGVPPAGALRAT